MTTPSQVRGFTLPELIVTLLVVGILAVFVMPRLTSMSAVRERSDYDKVLSAIAYARKAAIAKRRYACVSVSSTAVSLTIDPSPPESTAAPFGGSCPFSTALDLPSRDQSCPLNQTCLQASTISAAPSTFQFDALGRASATVTMTIAGYPTPITVEGETGYVH